MNPDGTPLVTDSKDKGEASSEVKSFTSEDLERALAKQKEEHDASLEALVQMRIATLFHGACTTFTWCGFEANCAYSVTWSTTS